VPVRSAFQNNRATRVVGTRWLQGSIGFQPVFCLYPCAPLRADKVSAHYRLEAYATLRCSASLKSRCRIFCAEGDNAHPDGRQRGIGCSITPACVETRTTLYKYRQPGRRFDSMSRPRGQGQSLAKRINLQVYLGCRAYSTCPPGKLRAQSNADNGLFERFERFAGT
jgi:hypothetical protein